ncbi:MAG: replicative DNA helicase [Legionellales bacterium]|jgi:replicative DNA helicase
MTDVDELKVPPHSIEAEQSILGGLMLDNEAWERVSERVTEEDFYRHDHRLIFRAMQNMVEKIQPIDVITLSENLTALQKLDAVGGLAYLIELAKNTPGASNVAAYADIIRERGILRRLISAGNEIAQSGYNPRGQDPMGLVDEAERKVFAIAEEKTRGKTGPQSVKGLLVRAVERIDHLFHAQSTVTGMATGYDDFDNLTAGLQHSDLIIVAGRPSMGKTTFAMNIVENIIIKEKKPALIFSLEMPGEQLATRMISSLGQIEQHRLRTGKLVEEDWPRFSSAVSILNDTALFIDDTPGMSPGEIRTRARRAVREHGELGVIVVDYLQLMTVPGNKENRTTEISEISRSLKLLAKELKVPVIALSQLNRELEHRPNKRPIMSDLRESGAIEQDADLIVFIYRDEVYNKETPDKNVAEVIIAKQRNGPTGTVRLTFRGQYCRFENFTADNYSY